MTTTKSTWQALSLVSVTLWLAALSVVGLTVIYRGNHPEAWHAYHSACCLALFYGTPVQALLTTGVIAAARSRGEVVPAVGWWSGLLVGGLMGLALISVVVMMCLSFVAPPDR